MEAWILIGLIIFFICYQLKLIWLALGWRRAFRQSEYVINGKPPTEWPELSAIVCFHNEAQHIDQLLSSLSAQKYAGAVEFILVDDRSTDRTPELLQAWAEKDPRIRIITISNTSTGLSPKKYALQQGMKATRFDHWVFTDADCILPAGWLTAYGLAYAAGAELVLGLSPYLPTRPWLLHRLVQYETFHTALLYMASAGWQRPYMAVGRNMGYRRTVFMQANGFATHADQLSGDDDLFVNGLKPTVVVQPIINPSLLVYSQAPAGWSAWIHQKIRHLSASTHYQSRAKGWLMMYHLLSVGNWLLLLMPLLGIHTYESLCIFVVNHAGKWLLVFYANRQSFRSASIQYWFSLGELLYACYLLLLVPLSRLIRPQWKRTVNPLYAQKKTVD
jgi:cellulose synthase/poly-beta-1,6-N-acetylglucosamine synthase-like glycosyltransferase